MYNLSVTDASSYPPVDYLVIGHLACDRTPHGLRLGGTAAYSALTARALGLRVGVVTAWGGEFALDKLDGIPVHIKRAPVSTTFENIYKPEGRVQFLHHLAPDLTLEDIPAAWRSVPIIQIGPIAQEGKSLLAGGLSPSLLGVTPQGWMRAWDGTGRVHPVEWEQASTALPLLGAAVISVEDVGGDEDKIEMMANACRVLAVTENSAGARLFWNGDSRRFSAPAMKEVDPCGAGDIFAAAFFWRLHGTSNPWEAARFATRLAAYSVTREGMEGIPTQQEIQNCLLEVL